MRAWNANDEKAIWTGLSRNLDAEGEAAIRNTSPFWKNHDQGAATVVVAAFDPALDGEWSESNCEGQVLTINRIKRRIVARLPNV